jgi:4-aminobutyrate aminotransferase/(S)-3-amino-2-methylpropionate transaminase
MKYPMA